MIIREFDGADAEAVVALGREAELTRPWNDPYADIERKLAVQPELFLVADDGGTVIGSVTQPASFSKSNCVPSQNCEAVLGLAPALRPPSAK